MNTIEKIASIDEKLRVLREAWSDSPPETREKWCGMINKALDERIALMKIRDGK